MKIHEIAAAPREVVLGGKTYLASPMRPRDIGRLSAFLADRIPDPRSVARKYMEGLPPDVQIAMWDKACEEAQSWPPTIEDSRAEDLFLTSEGMALIVEMALSRANHGITREVVATIADAMDESELFHLMAAVFPTVPEPPSDPKPTEATTARTPPIASTPDGAGSLSA